jgi:hypothetical protein
MVGSTCRSWNRVSICQQSDMKTIFGDTHFFPYQLIANLLALDFTWNFPLWGKLRPNLFQVTIIQDLETVPSQSSNETFQSKLNYEKKLDELQSWFIFQKRDLSDQINILFILKIIEETHILFVLALD